jgi:hypothetical protein
MFGGRQGRRAMRACLGMTFLAGGMLVAPVTATGASGAYPSSGTSLAPAGAPAVPCATPSTTGATSSYSKAGNTAGAKGGAWTGVTERVDAILNPDGSVAQTPSQTTSISVAGSTPVTIRVPVSGSISSHRKKHGRGTPVVNGQAVVSLSPNGTAAQEVKSDFTRPLPVTVTVTFTLNGKPISSNDIKGKSGTVRVTYKIANVTSKKISACFEGFNGKQQHQMVSTPVPIVADFSFTVPSHATGFTAPGASLSANSNGVAVGWTPALFEPLGPLTQTFTFTMKTSDASIPTATLLLLTVNPFTITGEAPATSAVALGTAEAAVAKGTSAVQGALGKLQQSESNLQSTTSSSAGDPPGDPSPVTTAVDADLAKLATSITAVRAKLGPLSTSLGTLASDGTGIGATASDVAAVANTISTDAASIATPIDGLTAQFTTGLENVSLLVQQFKQLQIDLSAFPASEQNTPEFIQLAKDLGIAQTIGGKVSSALADAQQFVQAVTGALQTLQSDVTSLVAKAQALRSAAAALAALALSTLQADFATLQDRVNALQAEFAGIASDIKARFAQLEATVSSDRARLAAAVAAAKQALANALLQGEQAVQASLNQALAQAAQVESKAQQDIASANAKYAQLLALDDQAVLNQLPGGDVTGVTMQNGTYVYLIKGR